MSSEDQQPGADALTQAQQHRLDRHWGDQDRTLLAMRQLETALATAAPRRERAWRDEVRRALGVLAEAAGQEAKNASQPDSLLCDIARTQPWLRNRVRGLRIRYAQLRDSIAALHDELAQDGPAGQFADIRQRLARVLNGLRDQQGRESDLIYEAYYDAFGSDLPRDASSQLPDSPRRAVALPGEFGVAVRRAGQHLPGT
jgi:hypothetical protein